MPVENYTKNTCNITNKVQHIFYSYRILFDTTNNSNFLNSVDNGIVILTSLKVHTPFSSLDYGVHPTIFTINWPALVLPPTCLQLYGATCTVANDFNKTMDINGKQEQAFGAAKRNDI